MHVMRVRYTCLSAPSIHERYTRMKYCRTVQALQSLQFWREVPDVRVLHMKRREPLTTSSQHTTVTYYIPSCNRLYVYVLDRYI